MKESPPVAAARGIIALIALGAAAPARADPPDVAVALQWHSGDGCLDSDRLFDAVQGRSRRSPVRASDEAAAIITGRADRRPEDSGWQVELTVVDRAGAVLGRRSLTVPEPGCDALREHVAVVVAMLIDSSIVEGGGAVMPPPPAPPPPARPPPARPPPAPQRPPRWSVDAAVAAVIEAGRLPGTTPGIGAAIGVTSPRHWRIELGGFGYAQASAADGTGRTTIRWITGALAGCAPGLEPEGWRFAACAGVDVGVMTGEGAGFTRNRLDRQLVVDGFAGGRIERHLVGPTYLELGFTVRLALRRPRFGYQDETGAFRPLYEPAWAGTTGQLGLGAYFQ